MNKEKIKNILDCLSGAICALCLVHQVPVESPALKQICKLLNDLEELLSEGE